MLVYIAEVGKRDKIYMLLTAEQYDRIIMPVKGLFIHENPIDASVAFDMLEAIREVYPGNMRIYTRCKSVTGLVRFAKLWKN